MSRAELGNLTVTSWDYIRDNFQPDDRLAVVIKNRQEVIQRIATAAKIASEPYQAWLRFHNAHGADIYISMNTLKPEALGRTKNDIEAVRHIYLDLDHDAAKTVAFLGEDIRVPNPSYVLNTSEGKYQVIWKISECDPSRAERLQQSMAIEYNADRAATDVTRVLRIPGFYNHKYEPPYKVTAESLSADLCSIDDFIVPNHSIVSTIAEAKERRFKAHPEMGQFSQSEKDWAAVCDRLEKGEDPEQIKMWLASSRPDKANPNYYAAITVTKALNVIAKRKQEPSPEL